MIIELIAKKENMKMVSMPIQLNDEDTLSWITNSAKGYAPDAALKDLVGFDAEMEGFEVYSKVIGAPALVSIAPDPASAMVTPTKHKKIEVQVDSPQGIADAIPEPESDEGNDDDAAAADDVERDEIRVEDLQEHDIINGLKALFIEKSNRDPTEEECQKWLEEIRSAKAEQGSTDGELELPAPPSSPVSEEEATEKSIQAKRS